MITKSDDTSRNVKTTTKRKDGRVIVDKKLNEGFSVYFNKCFCLEEKTKDLLRNDEGLDRLIMKCLSARHSLMHKGDMNGTPTREHETAA